MGLAASDTDTNGTLVEETVIRELSPGHLQSALVSTPTPNIQCGAVLARLYIQRGGVSLMESSACLIDDYVFSGHSAAWDGSITILPGDQLRLSLISSEIARVRASVSIEPKSAG